MSLSRLLLLAALCLTITQSVAQTDVAPESLDRPPVAAPTSKIQVGAIPVVLSTSQEVDNFAAGLVQGLMADGRANAVAVFMVQEDRVMVQRNLGMVGPDTRFDTGGLSGLFETIAAMQSIERGKKEAELVFSGDLGFLINEGFYVAPHIFTNVPPDSGLAQEEIFGPVLAVFKARDLTEALALANNTRFALTGGFFHVLIKPLRLAL